MNQIVSLLYKEQRKILVNLISMAVITAAENVIPAKKSKYSKEVDEKYMPFTKEELSSDLYNVGELYEHFHNLNEKTKNLSNEFFNDGVESIKLIDLRLSEIYSLFNTAKLFLSIKGDLNHYEFSSLLHFWEDAYFQMYLVANDNDKNTSWMQSKVDNYLGQHVIVESMLKSHLKELKEMLGMETTD